MDFKKAIQIFNTNDFKFEPKYHKYTYKGEKFESVTTFINKFKVPFDTNMSRKKAIDYLYEHDIEVTENNILERRDIIQKSWDDKRDRANLLGTLVHQYIEEYFDPNLDTSYFDDEEVIERIEKFREQIIPRISQFECIAQELRIFSKKLKLAGTIDALFIKNGKLYIFDWKTNSKFKTDNDRYFNMLLDVFNLEKDNELNKYSIQLSLYQLILAEYNIKVSDLAIIYIPKEGDCKIYKCKNYVYLLEKYFGVSFYSDLK
jgi:ATP-dependent exoDNAse (exonuclease V) beta subunit